MAQAFGEEGSASLGRCSGTRFHLRDAASDPLCAEHQPGDDENDALHGAAFHACQLASETSCERGTKYLDRSRLVPTLEHDELAFFAGLENDEE